MVQLLPESFRTREGQNGRLSTILKHGSWLKGRVDFHFFIFLLLLPASQSKSGTRRRKQLRGPSDLTSGAARGYVARIGEKAGHVATCIVVMREITAKSVCGGDKESITLVTLFGGNQPPWWGHLPQFFVFWKTKLKNRISSDEDQNLPCHAPSVSVIILFNLTLLIIFRLWKNLKRK